MKRTTMLATCLLTVLVLMLTGAAGAASAGQSNQSRAVTYPIVDTGQNHILQQCNGNENAEHRIRFLWSGCELRRQPARLYR